MKYIKLFENRNLDLRKLGSIVYCKKTLKIDHNNKIINFLKNKYYTVKGSYGDPQTASEVYKLNYMPFECISAIIVNDDNYDYKFKVYPKNNQHSKYLDFFEYFEIPEFANKIDKYNL